MSITTYKKITELVDNNLLKDTDYLAVANSTVTSKLTITQLMDHVKTNAGIEANNIIDGGTAGKNVFRSETAANARNVLELGTIATKNTITISEVDFLTSNLSNLQTQINSNDSDISDLFANVGALNTSALLKENNLSELTNPYISRINLGVGFHNNVHFSHITANGFITSEFANSTQGGSVLLNISTTGSTLSGGKIRFDTVNNRIRFFETGGNMRGMYLDLSQGSNNIGSAIWNEGNFDPNTKVSKEGTSLQVPAGTTAQRPSSPSTYLFRFNTTDTKFEGWNGTEWGEIGGGFNGPVSSTADRMVVFADTSGKQVKEANNGAVMFGPLQVGRIASVNQHIITEANGTANYIKSTSMQGNPKKLIFDIDTTGGEPANSQHVAIVYDFNGTQSYELTRTISRFEGIRINRTTINQNITIPSNYNGSSAGPVTVANGYVVTVSSGSTWSIT